MTDTITANTTKSVDHTAFKLRGRPHEIVSIVPRSGGTGYKVTAKHPSGLGALSVRYYVSESGKYSPVLGDLDSPYDIVPKAEIDTSKWYRTRDFSRRYIKVGPYIFSTDKGYAFVQADKLGHGEDYVWVAGGRKEGNTLADNPLDLIEERYQDVLDTSKTYRTRNGEYRDLEILLRHSGQYERYPIRSAAEIPGFQSLSEWSANGEWIFDHGEHPMDLVEQESEADTPAADTSDVPRMMLPAGAHELGELNTILKGDKLFLEVEVVDTWGKSVMAMSATGRIMTFGRDDFFAQITAPEPAITVAAGDKVEFLDHIGKIGELLYVDEPSKRGFVRTEDGKTACFYLSRLRKAA